MVRKAVLFKNAILRFHIYFLTSDWDVNFCKVFFSSPKENLTTVLKWTRNLNFSPLLLQQIPIRGQNHMLVILTGYIDVDANADTDNGDDDEEDEERRKRMDGWDRKELSLLLKRSFALIWHFKKNGSNY